MRTLHESPFIQPPPLSLSCSPEVFTEHVMDHLAFAMCCEPTALRTANLYAAGDKTHFDQPLVSQYL